MNNYEAKHSLANSNSSTRIKIKIQLTNLTVDLCEHWLSSENKTKSFSHSIKFNMLTSGSVVGAYTPFDLCWRSCPRALLLLILHFVHQQNAQFWMIDQRLFYYFLNEICWLKRLTMALTHAHTSVLIDQTKIDTHKHMNHISFTLIVAHTSKFKNYLN